MTGLRLTSPGIQSGTAGVLSTLTLGGATLGSDTLAVTGTTSVGNVNLTSTTIPVNGVYKTSGASTVGFATNTTTRMSLTNAQLASITSGSWQLGLAASTSTAPSLVPNNTAITTGFGGDGTNLYGIIAGATAVTWAPTRETLAGGFTFGAALTANNPGTAGFSAIQTASILTDSGTTGTTAALYGNVFGGNTIVATNTKTYTNEYGTYFLADIAGTGTTLSAKWALGADSASIGGTLINSSGAITANGSIFTTNAGSLGFSGRSRILSPQDGVIEFTNNGSTGLTRIQFGGTTSSFGSLQTNGTIITTGLADGTAGGIFAVSGGLTLSGGTLLTTSAALTNNAAAQIATMTNGPTAGNPTKWIPVNDNGTIRNIPAW